MQQMTTASDSCTRDIRYKFTEIAACFDTGIGIIDFCWREVLAGGRFFLPLLAFYISPHRQHYGFADQGDVRKEIMPPAVARAALHPDILCQKWVRYAEGDG